MEELDTNMLVAPVTSRNELEVSTDLFLRLETRLRLSGFTGTLLFCG